MTKQKTFVEQLIAKNQRIWTNGFLCGVAITMGFLFYFVIANKIV